MDQQIQSPEQPPLPATTPPSGDKVCIGFSCLNRHDGYGNAYRNYKLCLVDLNSDDVISGDEDDGDGDGYARIYPTLHISTPISGEHAFCVWNQTLYVFEDCPDVKSLPNQKSIFAYDLRSTAQNKLTKIGNMIYPKVGPTAVPTPDGKKILLLATRFHDNTLRKFGGVFELFDPATKTSEPLPPINEINDLYYSNFPPINDLDYSNFHCSNLHGFISMSKFAVRITGLGNYVIDLDSGERIWERLPESFFKGLDLEYMYMYEKLVFMVVGDRFLFTPDGVQDMINSNDDDVIKRYRTSSSFSVESKTVCSRFSRVSNFMTLLKHDCDKGEFDFCVLDCDEDLVKPWPASCDFSIDVCRAVYPKKGEEEKPLEVELKSSRALKISGETDDEILRPCFIFRV